MLPAHRRLMRSPWLPSSSSRSSRQKKKTPPPCASSAANAPGPHRLLRPAAVVMLHAACVRLRHGRRRLVLAVHGPAVYPAAVAPPPLAGPPTLVSHASASSPGIARADTAAASRGPHPSLSLLLCSRVVHAATAMIDEPCSVRCQDSVTLKKVEELASSPVILSLRAASGLAFFFVSKIELNSRWSCLEKFN